jgi:hypothetical protein
MSTPIPSVPATQARQCHPLTPSAAFEYCAPPGPLLRPGPSEPQPTRSVAQRVRARSSHFMTHATRAPRERPRPRCSLSVTQPSSTSDRTVGTSPLRASGTPAASANCAQRCPELGPSALRPQPTRNASRTTGSLQHAACNEKRATRHMHYLRDAMQPTAQQESIHARRRPTTHFSRVQTVQHAPLHAADNVHAACNGQGECARGLLRPSRLYDQRGLGGRRHAVRTAPQQHLKPHRTSERPPERNTQTNKQTSETISQTNKQTSETNKQTTRRAKQTNKRTTKARDQRALSLRTCDRYCGRKKGRRTPE